jgi:CheY-like chemotaxis protein
LIDTSQIDRVLTELVINAREAIDGEGTITIETRAQDLDAAFRALHAGMNPGRHAVLEVTDDGRGIPPEALAHLFEPFSTAKGAHERSGLGLATVYGIVKQNHGFVDVNNNDGEGTTVRIYLPTAATPGAASGAIRPGGHETVLLVGDEGQLLRLARRLLEAQGYTVLAAGSAEQALAIAQATEDPIHLLVADGDSPGLVGGGAWHELVRSRPNLRALFMTDNPATDPRHLGFSEGGRLIRKPFSMAALAAAVRQALDAPPRSSPQRAP